MAKGPETRLQSRIRKALTQRFPDIFLFKVHGGRFQSAGIPDLLGCIRGHMIGLEVKVPGRENRATALQLQQIDKMNKAGAYATIVTSVEQAVQFVESILEI